MNGLRAKARAVFANQQQWRLEHTLHCTQVIQLHQNTTVDGPVLIQCPPGAPSDGCLGRLQDWLDGRGNQEDAYVSRVASNPEAAVKIVVIDHLQDEIDEHLLLGIHRITFDELFRIFEFDDYLLYLLLRNVDGFYNVNQEVKPRQLDTRATSFYVGIRGFYTVIWRTHREEDNSNTCLKTNAIIICRPDLISDLLETLDVYKDLAGHPLMLLLACAGHLLQEVDKKVFTYLRNICETEEQTGFSREIDASYTHSRGRNKRINHRKEMDLGHLSANMSSTLAGLALYLKHLNLATVLTNILTKPTDDSVDSSDENDLKRRDITETAQILYKSSMMTTEYVTYLQKRAQIQQSVVCLLYLTHLLSIGNVIGRPAYCYQLSNLIAKQDATAAISLAEDSKRLAVAAGNESFSMQTLAVLTMAFLPATFLATVFAMPIMKWEQGMGSVMRPELGLYFGLSVPITLGIFIAWTYLTRHRKRVAEKEERESRKTLEQLLRRRRQDFRPLPAKTDRPRNKSGSENV